MAYHDDKDTINIGSMESDSDYM